MNLHTVLVVGILGALLSTPAFAGDLGAAAAPSPSRLRVQAQVEVLPTGSESLNADTPNGTSSLSMDADVAYGITGMIDYDLTPYLAVGVAPRLVLNVKVNDPAFRDRAGEELDLRAHVLGHLPVAPGVELYASLSPGYADLLDDAHSTLSGFALAGALGATFRVSPRVFLSGELGYQRVFSSRDTTFEIPGTGTPFVIKNDVDLSYLHIGLGAGTHF